MSTSCSDIPRGTDVTTKELSYILGFTNCRTVCVENPYVLGKLSEIISELPKLEHIILVDDQNQALDKYELGNVTLHRFRSIVKAGKKWREENPEVIETNILNIKPEETATIGINKPEITDSLTFMENIIPRYRTIKNTVRTTSTT